MESFVSRRGGRSRSRGVAKDKKNADLMGIGLIWLKGGYSRWE